VYSVGFVDALVAAGAVDVGVHVKVDTGMQRVGAQPADVSAVVRAVDAAAPALALTGVFTHLAVADEPARGASADQLAVFDAVLSEVRAIHGDVPVVHAANSAGAMVVPDARRSFVRVGIATYGISPGPELDGQARRLRPVMSLRARVSYVKRVAAGSHVSYGWRHRFDRATTVATLPLGYADGVPRRMGTLPDRPGADVLIGGRRCPIVGVVTMDQLMVDVGDADVAVGDEAVLIGGQGRERIRAEDWAERLGTIGYEIVCGISARIPRLVVDGSESAVVTPAP
jgi:alanine racemase